MSTLEGRLSVAAGELSGDRYGVKILPWLVLLWVLVTWEFGAKAFGIPTYLLPPPSDIAMAFVWNYPVILAELGTTLWAFSIAFGLTVFAGYLLAMLMYEWRILEATLYPYVIVARAIPIVSLIPLIIIWFGFGVRSIVMISFLISFFAMVVNSLAGFKSTEKATIEMLESFSASRWDLYKEVHFYTSLPLVFAGTKICVILAFTGVIVGEFLMGSAGIGFLILEYNNSLATAKMFASIFTIAVTQLFLFGTVVLLERRIVQWT